RHASGRLPSQQVAVVVVNKRRLVAGRPRQPVVAVVRVSLTRWRLTSATPEAITCRVVPTRDTGIRLTDQLLHAIVVVLAVMIASRAAQEPIITVRIAVRADGGTAALGNHRCDEPICVIREPRSKPPWAINAVEVVHQRTLRANEAEGSSRILPIRIS